METTKDGLKHVFNSLPTYSRPSENGFFIKISNERHGRPNDNFIRFFIAD